MKKFPEKFSKNLKMMTSSANCSYFLKIAGQQDIFATSPLWLRVPPFKRGWFTYLETVKTYLGPNKNFGEKIFSPNFKFPQKRKKKFFRFFLLGPSNVLTVSRSVRRALSNGDTFEFMRCVAKKTTFFGTFGCWKSTFFEFLRKKNWEFFLIKILSWTYLRIKFPWWVLESAIWSATSLLIVHSRAKFLALENQELWQI